MKKVNRILRTIVLVSLFSALMAPAAWARTAISGLGVRIKTDLEAGSTLPTMSIGNDDTNCVYTTSDRYDIVDVEWSSSVDRELQIGDTPRLKIYLEANGDYYFRNSYSSSKVSVQGGEFVSARHSNGQMVVTVETKAVKGQFDPPADAYWDNARGRAVWERPDNRNMSSGAYDVYLYRGGSIVTKLENYTRTSYNFYPYMTQRGTYTFRVRTVPSNNDEEKYGKKSGWTISDELYLDSDEVSDGTGQNAGEGMTNSGGIVNVGWQNTNGGWYFRYPDGTYQKSGWLKVDGKWYYFDGDGRMLEGWQNVNNIWYYLNPNAGGPEGSMVTGWLKEGNVWYYLNPNEGGPEGAMVTNSWIQINGKTYYVNANGVMAEGWNQVGGQWYYFYPGSGEKAVSTVIDGFPVDAQGVWNKASMIG